MSHAGLGILAIVIGFIMNGLARVPVVGMIVPLPWLWVWLIPLGAALIFSGNWKVALIAFIATTYLMFSAGWITPGNVAPVTGIVKR